MRLFLSWVIPTLLLGCAHGNSSLSNEPNIINLGGDFKSFWEQAKDRPVNEQLVLWDQVVESRHREYYSTLVWRGLEDRKAKLLSNAFKNYSENFKKIKDAFNDFDKTVKTQMRKFCGVFPECSFNGSVLALPAPTFNGKTSHIESDPSRQVLAFGIDSTVSWGDNLDVLYSHEFFHIYHGKMSGVRDDGATSGLPITMPLWSEGLATYASHEMNPNAKMKDVFMSDELAALDERRTPELARAFLRNSSEKTSNQKLYQSWFNGNRTFSKTFPPRSGYFLGYKVVMHLRLKHSLKEMALWSSERANEAVITALKELSADRL